MEQPGVRRARHDLERLAAGDWAPPVEIPMVDRYAWPTTDARCMSSGGFREIDPISEWATANPGKFAPEFDLRGQTNEQQISAFFQPLFVVAVQIAFNQSRQPSGFGFVQFRSPEDTTQALHRTNQVLGSRYVEIFRCTRAEMEQARMHALTEGAAITIVAIVIT